MKGDNPFHRIRVGDYRIIYEIHGDILVIIVLKIGHRKEVYRRLY
jgi:mRNA interferase RelE/StbE